MMPTPEELRSKIERAEGRLFNTHIYYGMGLFVIAIFGIVDFAHKDTDVAICFGILLGYVLFFHPVMYCNISSLVKHALSAAPHTPLSEMSVASTTVSNPA
jgi:hypothetical protein